MITEINQCRLCRATELSHILSLGEQALTGIFPQSKSQVMTHGPLVLVKCAACDLVQLKHSCEPSKLYGTHYGYRSSLNGSMVEHLKSKAHGLQQLAGLQKNDYVLDIGSNDGTFLGFFPVNDVHLIGFDPSGEKFKKYYRSDIQLIIDFFSSAKLRERMGNIKMKIVTSVAMLYDLEDPLGFAQQIESLLSDDGVWHFEQIYLPSMLEINAYDTICHEHLEYYALKQIKWMTDHAGLKIIGLEKNKTNGGSLAVTVAKNIAPYPEITQSIQAMLAEEDRIGLSDLAIYRTFAENIQKNKDALISLLQQLKTAQQKVYGYGASTKGNVVLQHCGIDESLLSSIAEVNADKFGHYTPGSNIPILSEAVVHAMKPDYFLVLPWHFKENILAREQEYLRNGGKFIFALPQIEIVQQ